MKFEAAIGSPKFTRRIRAATSDASRGRGILKPMRPHEVAQDRNARREDFRNLKLAVCRIFLIQLVPHRLTDLRAQLAGSELWPRLERLCHGITAAFISAKRGRLAFSRFNP